MLRGFEPNGLPDNLTASDEGLEKLDAICMQLIATGEGVKNLDKVTGGSLLPGYPQVNWKRCLSLPDILSHHYFDVDAEVVYAVCAKHIENLASPVQVMLYNQ